MKIILIFLLLSMGVVDATENVPPVPVDSENVELPVVPGKAQTAAIPQTNIGEGIDKNQEAVPGVKLAEAVSATTGLAISPLFGAGIVGAWHYIQTPSTHRSNLPWHTHPWFWGPALALVLLLILKEPMLYFLPGAKKPLDVLEVLENKLSAVIVTPLVVNLALQTFSAPSPSLNGINVVCAALPLGNTGLMWVTSAGFLVLFFCVWLVFHAVNVLILLSPSATLDMAMRLVRGSVLGGVTLSAVLNPWIGLAISLVVIFFCAKSFGWATRLVVYGMTILSDWLLKLSPNMNEKNPRFRAFLVSPRNGLPMRSWGYLKNNTMGCPVFVGRSLPWLASVEIPLEPRNIKILKGMIGPVVKEFGPGFPVSILAFPPRYAKHEESIAHTLGIECSLEHPLKKNWQMALEWLAETLQRKGLKTTVMQTHSTTSDSLRL